MIKLNKNTGELTRERLPNALKGLSAESLADLTWTDPALGLHDFAWWPEQNVSEPLSDYQKYGDERYEVDLDLKIVRVEREALDWTDEEMDSYVNNLVNKKLKELSDYFSEISARPVIDTGYGFSVQAGFSDLASFQVGLDLGLYRIRAADNKDYEVSKEQFEDVLLQIKQNGARLMNIKWALQDEIEHASIEELEQINFEERFND